MATKGKDIKPAEREEPDVLWGFFEEGEQYAEKYVPAMKRLAGEEIPIIKAGSLAILAFGIRSYREFLFGSVALAAYYYMSKDDGSLDGAVTGLSGVQLARGQYLTASFPTFIESYQSFKEWREGRFMTRKQILKLLIYISGFYLGLKKHV